MMGSGTPTIGIRPETIATLMKKHNVKIIT
jgi:hypothetical protein